MRNLRAILPILCVLILYSPARSQEYQQWEIFGGFDYLNVNGGGVTLASGQNINLQHNAYGWHFTTTENKFSWMGGVVDLSGDYSNPTVNLGTPTSPVNVRFNRQAYPILFGPRFYYRKLGRVTLFGEPMIGLAVARLNVASKSEFPELLGLFPSTKTSWAYALGGGADYNLTNLIAIRGQFDWIRSHFPETLARDYQNNYRVAGGIVFKFH